MLISTTTNLPIRVGDIVHFGPNPCIVTYAPMDPSSQKVLYLETMDELKISFRATPESIGAVWKP